MSSSIFTPSNQVRLTNVSVVRLKKAGMRFELACYKNKVVDYRNRVERDLDQVLQVHAVFINVSKGQLARNEDLLQAFKTQDTEKIILEILEKGELQVGEKERDVQTDSLHKEVVSIIAGKCVNPITRTPYPPALIEKALASIHFAPNCKKGAKQQALECIRALGEKKEFPIARARMRLRVEVPHDLSGTIEEIKALFAVVESSSNEDNLMRTVGLVEPMNYRGLVDLVSKQAKGQGVVHIESLREVKEQDTNYL
jgi:ribosome maturation protein SDO1